MNGTKVRVGQTVESGSGAVWTALDRSPKPACWWLHRWYGETWQTTEIHSRNLTLIADPYRTDRA